MNTKTIFRAALSMTAALMMTACSSDDNMTEVPAAPSAPKTIPYTVTVGSDDATTRATVGDDADRTLYFAAGDKLYITGTNIQGVLNLKAGDAGKTSATFSGSLTYSGDGTPASGLSLNATLVSAQQSVGNEVSVDAAGAVTVNYPTTAYCDDVATAVQKYSRLTGSSTYGSKSFTLTQQTAFLNFEITFEDGTGTTALSAVVSNGGSALCTANVYPATVNQKTVAKFVLPVASGTVLSGATVKMGDKEALTISDATLTGKVYNVKKTQEAAVPTAYTLAESTVGMIVGSDGKAYAAADKDNLPTGVTAAGMVAYKSGSNGLVIALTDEGDTMEWAMAKSTCESKTPAITGVKWKLPSQDDWKNMFKAFGGSDASYTGLNNALATAGGDSSKLQDYGNYWSSTGADGNRVWNVDLENGVATWYRTYKDFEDLVRACLAF